MSELAAVPPLPPIVEETRIARCPVGGEAFDVVTGHALSAHEGDEGLPVWGKPCFAHFWMKPKPTGWET